MKFIIKKTNHTFLFCMMIFLITSCTKDFKGLNQDDKLISDADLFQDANEGGFLLPTMMNNIVSTGTGVQTQQNLQSESYAGYLESPTPFLNNENTMTYFMVNQWPNSWNISTNGVMNNWLLMNKRGFETKYPDLYAIATIIKVAAAHRLVDVFGPYPYSKYGQGAEVAFDSEEQAYTAFFVDLDKAVKALLAAEAANPNADMTRFAKWDRSTFGGEYTKWIRLANTLRLRLAMRISVVSPAKAKEEAEKATLPANGGLMSDATGSFSVVNPSGNPYFTMSNAWSDTRVSAAVVTYLEGFGDPRLSAYTLPAVDPALGGKTIGIRPGVAKPTKAVYQDFSKYNVLSTTPVKQVDVAESYFLRAEGALRGWNMGTGTSKSFYEDGIRASLKANGVSEGSYLSSITKQTAYVDPKNPANNSPAISNVTVAWDEAASFEGKLEKIITQKWISIFPEGTEAWSEFRRTGYPKQYHVMVSYNPDLPLGTYIKRLAYLSSVVSTSEAAVKAAVSTYLKGKDSPATPLWWMPK